MVQPQVTKGSGNVGGREIDVNGGPEEVVEEGGPHVLFAIWHAFCRGFLMGYLYCDGGMVSHGVDITID